MLRQYARITTEKISEKKVGRRRIDFDRNESKVNSVDMQTMEDKVRKTQGDGKVRRE